MPKKKHLAFWIFSTCNCVFTTAGLHMQLNHVCVCVWVCTVPDDWCAPLGCETVTKQEDSVCPSVRLRQLYIPLWHVPIIKQEVCNRRGRLMWWHYNLALSTSRKQSVMTTCCHDTTGSGSDRCHFVSASREFISLIAAYNSVCAFFLCTLHFQWLEV